MRYATLLLIISIITHAGLQAQVVETDARMHAGTQSALEVDLTGEAKTAEKLWKSYVKKYGKVDWDRKNKEHVLFDVVIPEIDGEYAVTVISKFDKQGDATKGLFWFKMGDDFLNSADHGKELKGAGTFLMGYAHDVERNAITERYEDEEKQLGRLDKDLRKLEKQNEKLHKEIQKAKEAIAKAEREIEENLTAQETKTQEITDQKAKMEATQKELNGVGKN
ncbi:MAG: hypothetical protein AAFQ02_12405 [Bacteroidota bacterium]